MAAPVRGEELLGFMQRRHNALLLLGTTARLGSITMNMGTFVMVTWRVRTFPIDFPSFTTFNFITKVTVEWGPGRGSC